MCLCLAIGLTLTFSERLAEARRAPARLSAWATSSAYVSPGYLLQAAQRAVATDQLEQAQALTQRALTLAPYWGASWAMWGYLTARQLKNTAALPFYDHAWAIDRFGRKTSEWVAPLLWQSGWLTTEALLDRALRLASLPLAKLLPDAPPAAWPTNVLAENPTILTARNLDTLLGARRFQWLAALETGGQATDFDPARRAMVLTAACQVDAPPCVARLADCEARIGTCLNGVSDTRALGFSASQAALTAGQAQLAELWARRVMVSGSDAAAVRNLAHVLDKIGKADEARQLLRLHPALADHRP